VKIRRKKAFQKYFFLKKSVNILKMHFFIFNLLLTRFMIKFCVFTCIYRKNMYH